MLARSNPLAPGVYWIDVVRPFGSAPVHDNEPTFQDWAAAGGVRLLNEVHAETISPGGRVLVWHSFEVFGTPAPFPFRELGFPTVVKLASAPGGVTAADRATTLHDVVQTPEPAGLGDFFSDLEAQLAPTLERFLPVIAIGIGLYLWSRSTKGNEHAVH